MMPLLAACLGLQPSPDPGLLSPVAFFEEGAATSLIPYALLEPSHSLSSLNQGRASWLSRPKEDSWGDITWLRRLDSKKSHACPSSIWGVSCHAVRESEWAVERLIWRGSEAPASSQLTASTSSIARWAALQVIHQPLVVEQTRPPSASLSSQFHKVFPKSECRMASAFLSAHLTTGDGPQLGWVQLPLVLPITELKSLYATDPGS